jgi:hypothetical protein
MTTGPRGDDPTTTLHYTYDAWNRLTAVYADNWKWELNWGPGRASNRGPPMDKE